MKRFKNISLIYECDHATCARVAILARDNRARLTIVQVLKDLSAGREQVVTVVNKLIDVRKLVLQECQARLKEAAAAMKSLGVRPATQLLIGEPFLEIIRDVIEQRRDLVIMTAEGKVGLRQRLFGSTSSCLMRQCPCPVLVMKPGVKGRFRPDHGRDRPGSYGRCTGYAQPSDP
ncbi:MAG: universal stress protein [Planctomycetia bacterium]|nr:universal stress protein [Planctomycetia bacterium]